MPFRNPFEVIKQQMQAGLYASPYATFQSIRRTQGYRGLYAGFLPTLMREIPFDGIQFVLWEKLKTLQSAKSLVLSILAVVFPSAVNVTFATRLLIYDV